MMRREAPREAVSGSGMDRVVARRRIPLLWKIAGGVVALALLAAAFLAFAPRSGSQTVDGSRMTISAVTRGTFDDFIPLRARVTPLLTVYIDAVEGGRVEKMLVEDGATVQEGQPIAVLSNAELQLSTLARQTEVEQQINNMRSQELALAQTRLSNERAVLEAELAVQKARRQFEREKPLAERGFVTARQFSDTSDEYAYQQRRLAALKVGQATDARLQGSQLSQQQAAAQSMQSGLALARGNLDALNLRARSRARFRGFAIQIGQSLQRGERIGQIDSPGRNKLIAGVDEYYLGRVQLGQKATIEYGGKTYQAKVSKISPQVAERPVRDRPDLRRCRARRVQRGQTLQTKLVLGDPAPRG